MHELGWGNKFQAVDWKDFYPEANGPIPPNVPEPCGKCVQLNCFVDADHAGNQIHDDHIQAYCYSYVVHRLYGIQNDKIGSRRLPSDPSL